MPSIATAPAPDFARQQYENLLSLDIRVGTVVRAEPHSGSRKPMHVLTIDFGGNVGIKTTSAQITQNYPDPSTLIGSQIAAVVNMPGKRIAGVKSEVLLLAATDPSGSILLIPERKAENGVSVR